MGDGLAKDLANKYPNLKIEYLEFIKTFKDKNDLLGKVLLVEVKKDLYIANFFSQLKYGKDKNIVYTSYEAFESCINSLKEVNDNEFNLPIYFPKFIGCGLANGDWVIIRKLIQKIPKSIILEKTP